MKKILAYFLLLFSIISCEKEQQNPTPTIPVSRVVKYEITGNFSGTLTSGYTTKEGGYTNGTISALPWEMLIEYNPNVGAANLAVVGSNGMPGQMITLKIYQGNRLKATSNTTSDTNGSFSLGAPPVVF